MSDIFDRYEKKLSRLGVKVEGGEVKGAGSVKIGGGKYKRVNISGSFKCLGNLEVEEFKVAGSALVDGYLNCGVLSVAGSIKIEGDLSCSSGRVSGSVRVRNVSGGNLKVAGAIRGENIELESFSVSGSIKGAGVKADDIYFRLSGRSRVEYILAEEVIIEPSRKTRKFLPFTRRSGEPSLYLGSGGIKASRIDIRGVRIVGDVEANEVYLGGDTVIDGNVLYGEKLVVEENVKIKGEARKIG